MQRIQGIKIITTDDQQNATDLSEEPDQKEKPSQKKKENEEDNYAIRTFRDQLDDPGREKIKIISFECRREIIFVQMKERRDHVKPRRQGRGDAKKRQTDGGTFIEEKFMPEFNHH